MTERHLEDNGAAQDAAIGPVTRSSGYEPGTGKARNLLLLTCMPIRVTTISETGGTLVKIDGRFKVEDIEDFVRMFEQLDGDKALDLTELQSADRAAIKMFRDLIDSGVELRATAPYVDLLLKAAPNGR